MNLLVVVLGILLSATSFVRCFNIYESYQSQNQSLIETIAELEAESNSNGNVPSRKRRDIKVVTDSKIPQIPQTRSYEPCCKADTAPRFVINRAFVRHCTNLTVSKENVTVQSVRTLNRNSTEFKEKLKILKNNAVCQMQCVAQKYDLADKDGIVILQGLLKYMSTIYEGTWIAPYTKEIVTKCVNEIHPESTSYLKTKTPNTCNPALVTLSYCIFREIQMNCPPEYIGDIEACLRRINAYNRF